MTDSIDTSEDMAQPYSAGTGLQDFQAASAGEAKGSALGTADAAQPDGLAHAADAQAHVGYEAAGYGPSVGGDGGGAVGVGHGAQYCAEDPGLSALPKVALAASQPQAQATVGEPLSPDEREALRQRVMAEIAQRMPVVKRWHDHWREWLEEARKCGATIYQNRHLPGEPAVAFGNEAWAKFCDRLSSHPGVKTCARN